MAFELHLGKMARTKSTVRRGFKVPTLKCLWKIMGQSIWLDDWVFSRKDRLIVGLWEALKCPTKKVMSERIKLF